MQAQFESMMKELGGAGALEDIAGVAGPSGAKSKSVPAATSSKPQSSATGDETFQETIKKTMERMQASGESATAAASADDTDDLLAELMKQMQGGGLDGEGGEEEFSKMLMGMMEQLTNKEILYEPMKELDDKFPSWMEKNKATVSKEDFARYTEQQGLVSEIVKKFEEKSYADSNVADREYIVERMQKVCYLRSSFQSNLTYIRCKRLVPLLLTSSATWQQHKKLSGRRKKAAHSNNNEFNIIQSSNCSV